MGITIERAQPGDAGAIIAYMNRIGCETENLSFGSEGYPISEKDEEEIIREKNQSPRNALFLAKKEGVSWAMPALRHFPAGKRIGRNLVSRL